MKKLFLPDAGVLLVISFLVLLASVLSTPAPALAQDECRDQSECAASSSSSTSFEARTSGSAGRSESSAAKGDSSIRTPRISTSNASN